MRVGPAEHKYSSFHISRRDELLAVRTPYELITQQCLGMCGGTQGREEGRRSLSGSPHSGSLRPGGSYTASERLYWYYY